MHGIEPALLTIVWATAAGLVAQVVGHRWRIPAIVPLLVFGMVLGPSLLGVVQPATLGTGLSVIVKLAVAVILFDGALNLRLVDLRRAAGEVRSLVTIGALVTWIGATLAAWWIAELSLPVAVVFGALMTVTGPTVVQPLLRRVQLPRLVRTVLEGEAILIDPIGAVLAVAVVDIILGFSDVRPIGVLGGAWAYVGRLLVGGLVGGGGGLLLSRLLRTRGLVPHDLANLVSLSMVWGVFGMAEYFQAESGIMAAVAMGLVTQRGAVPEERRLRQFKEQLTVLGICLLFILLAAALPLQTVLAEGWRGFLTVLALMFIVRPISVVIALGRSRLTWRELAFISWIAPRGIVAASVASLFALTLAGAGYVEGERVLAIVFLTIAMTVTLQGLTATPLARLLGLETLAGQRVLIVGAGPLGIGIAQAIQRHGRPVMLIDRNRAFVEQAQAMGIEAREGNALDENVLVESGVEEAETFVAVTTNSEVNALAAVLAHDAFGVTRAYPALSDPSRGAGTRLLQRVGGRIAFGRPLDVREWDYALEMGDAAFVNYTVPAGAHTERLTPAVLPETVVVIARVRADSIEISHAQLDWRAGDQLLVLGQSGPDVTTALLDEVHNPAPEEDVDDDTVAVDEDRVAEAIDVEPTDRT